MEKNKTKVAVHGDTKSQKRSDLKKVYKADRKSDKKADYRKENKNEQKNEHKNDYKKKYDDEKNRKFTDKKDRNSPVRKKDLETKKQSMCPVFERCGGCQYIDTPYEEQLAAKQKNMKLLLGEFGKVEQIRAMKDPFHYRNKVHAVLSRKKDGTILMGNYEKGTHNVVAVDQCFIENKKADEIIRTMAKLFQSFKIKIYNEDTDFGLVRHLLVRTGSHTGQIMVVIVTTSPIFPSKNNFVKALRKEHPEVTTIVQNINDRQTSMVLGQREQVLYGKGYIEDTLCEKIFRISAKSFYQVNPVQTEVLYQLAIDMASLTGKEVVLDAYCGIGTIGILAAAKAKEVIGVELNKDAVKDANINAKRNEIANISFYNNDSGKFIEELSDQGKQIDVVIMDPPRSGSDEAFLRSLLNVGPKKIVYISCGPTTLARDLKFLTKFNKYEVKRICPVDMFPMTGHVETVCLLSRK